jgi:hypothetical protein
MPEHRRAEMVAMRIVSHRLVVLVNERGSAMIGLGNCRHAVSSSL